MDNGTELINNCKGIVLQQMKQKQDEAAKYNLYRFLRWYNMQWKVKNTIITETVP